MEEIIRAINISKTFQTSEGTVDAVKDVSFSIEKGDILESSVFPEQERVRWYAA